MTARIAQEGLDIDGLQTHTLAINIGRPFRVDELLRFGGVELGATRTPEILTTVGFVDADLARLSSTLAAERHSPAGGSLVVDALRIELIARLIDGHTSLRGIARRSTAQRIGVRALRLIGEYIEANLGGDMRIADLATLAGMSRFHFSRVFRATVGTTPHRYVLERRLERARALLKTTTVSMRDIAVTTGFADQSHLTRLVKRRFGVTPGVLRSG